MTDLSTTYLGLELKNPIVPSPSPLSQSTDGIRAMEDAGASAVVMYSLFEEQITQESQSLDHYLSYFSDTWAESTSHFINMEMYNGGPEAYLDQIRRAKEAVDIPIIASLNGTTNGGWTAYARLMQDAGADALELNVYYIPTAVNMRGGSIEDVAEEICTEVVGHVDIPVSVKLSPYYSSMANMALRLYSAGTSGLVLFNRFYQPDLDIEELKVVPSLNLSSSAELRLPLRWVAILYGRVDTDFAITTGVHTHEDVIKGVMAGAKITMMASELLKNGVGRIGEVLTGVETWMDEHEYESLYQMRGSMSQMRVEDPASFERANYMRILASWEPDTPTAG